MTFKTPLTLSLLGALALAGCVDPQSPTAGDRPRAQNGAVAGAVLGGLLGASSGDDKLVKAVVGAGIGAAIGGAIGATLDKQAADLRSSIGNDQVTVTNTGSELVVRMPQDILFAVDSAALRPDLARDIQAVSRNLLDYPNSTIQIVGHTDNTGEAAYNQDLSERRALAVAAALRSSGVPAGRVQAFGSGENQPIASNLTPEGRAQNRRVDIIIRPTN
ncbi:OmpA family protein [Fertoebacter nigrum]|uniref:OmpA family protein n=1 Tax=Fertoeibacter niger TaxID=2656921 RepID=A0A8X8H210_9RHOB|nr:OmpA family protein [Fertoeibacter niger]NUB44819.1 OmpA family protein [Fertoeibacter niger]